MQWLTNDHVFKMNSTQSKVILGHYSFPDATQSDLDRESFSYNGFPELKDSQKNMLALLGKKKL